MSIDFIQRLEKERISFYLNFIAKEMRNGKFSSYDSGDLDQIKNYYSLFNELEKNELIYQLLNTDAENIINWNKFFLQEKWNNILEVSSIFYSQKISKQFEEENCFSIVDVLLDNPKANDKAMEKIFNHLVWDENLVNYLGGVNLAYRSDTAISNVFHYLSKKNYLYLLAPENLKEFFIAYIDKKKYPMDLCMDLFFNKKLNLFPFNYLDNKTKEIMLDDKDLTLSLLVKSIRLSNKKESDMSFFASLKNSVNENELKDAYFNLNSQGDFISHTFNQVLKNKTYVDIKLLGNILSYFNYYNKIALSLNFSEIAIDMQKPINKIEDNEEKLLLLEKLRINAVVHNTVKANPKKMKI
jgi:hypothetical protein